MPAPKRANTNPATAAATAKRVRAGQDTAAAKLRAAGWVCIPPEDVERHADTPDLRGDLRINA